MREWRNGRRAGFRCQCPQGRGGSTPLSRTKVPLTRANTGNRREVKTSRRFSLSGLVRLWQGPMPGGVVRVAVGGGVSCRVGGADTPRVPHGESWSPKAWEGSTCPCDGVVSADSCRFAAPLPCSGGVGGVSRVGGFPRRGDGPRSRHAPHHTSSPVVAARGLLATDLRNTGSPTNGTPVLTKDDIQHQRPGLNSLSVGVEPGHK